MYMHIGKLWDGLFWLSQIAMEYGYCINGSPVFDAGDCLHESGDLAEKLRKGKAITVLISVMLLCIGYVGMYFNDIAWVNFMWNSYGNYFFMLLGSVPVILSFYCMCRILPLGSLAAKFISDVGRHTLFILGFEYTAGRIARLFLPAAVENWFTVFVGKCVLLLLGFGAWKFLVRCIPNDKIRAHLSRY